jgi:hypothetical protein
MALPRIRPRRMLRLGSGRCRKTLQEGVYVLVNSYPCGNLRRTRNQWLSAGGVLKSDVSALRLPVGRKPAGFFCPGRPLSQLVIVSEHDAARIVASVAPLFYPFRTKGPEPRLRLGKGVAGFSFALRFEHSP